MKIDFVMAVKNRDNERIQRCIDSISNLANEIFVIDYNSKKLIKVKGANILRYEGVDTWNKSHALNLGIKSSKADFIAAIDCDFILNEHILNRIEKELNENMAIFNTNVRRIELKDLSEDYLKMLQKSKPWFKDNPRANLYSGANGGIQIFSRKWINRIGGYDEGLGLYWGAMDNRIYEQAKMDGLNVLDLNMPMLHQEHLNQKENNLPQEEKEFASWVREFKINFIKKLVEENIIISTRKWGGKKPNHDWMIELVNEWKKNIIKRPKVYVALISNFDTLPTYFALNLMRIVDNARENGIQIIVNNMKAAAIDSIRNYSVVDATCKECTHILQLDTDHFYPDDLVIRLVAHQKDFVCGITTRKVQPFEQTQFKKIGMKSINVEGNICKFFGNEGLMEIGGTGMVGSLIKLDLFEKIKFPYYNREYEIVDGKIRETGEDIYFCKKLKAKGIKLFCDTSLSYPHQLQNTFSDKGQVILK